jgi:hypothetical protein
MALPLVAPEMDPKVVRLSSSSYGVRLLGAIPVTFNTRSSAHICARELRRFLRRCSDGSGVDPTLLATLISTWFAQAVSEPGLVVPPPIVL